MQELSSKIVYLNGKFVSLNKAYISVMDRGFLFGDGVYEVIPVCNKNIFRLQQHLDRLEISLKSIEINCTLDFEELKQVINKLLKFNSKLGNDQLIYLQITRGVAFERTHIFPTNISPTVFISTSKYKPLSYSDLKRGGTAKLFNDIRWSWCYIKSINLLPNTILTQKAYENNCDEAILIKQGIVTEGASSNVFIVKDGLIRTPYINDNILRGVTRDFIIEIIKKLKIDLEESPIKIEEILYADEVWITNSVKGILPIVRLNDNKVGDGLAGPYWEQVINQYNFEKEKSIITELITI